MFFTTRDEIESAVVWTVAGEEGELELELPVLGIQLKLTITLAENCTRISDAGIQSIFDLQILSDEDREAIVQILYDDALKVREEVDFPRKVDVGKSRPAGWLGRLFGSAGPETRHELIPPDDPEHPCYLPRGKDSVLGKITWTGLRIEEYLETRHRFAFIDCRPAWEQEHGRAIVLRDGLPCGLAEFEVDVSEFDDPSGLP